MRNLKPIPFFFLLIFSACQTSPKTERGKEEIARHVKSIDFQDMLDSTLVIGSILIYDSEKNEFYSNDFEWAETGFIPASTFKIVNSVNALENNIVENDSTLFYWDGEPKFLRSWEQDMNFYQAYQRSCVPCYQQIARETGAKRMKTTLERIGYPGMVFDSTNIDQFWLEGESRITQFQQIDFLRRIRNKGLPVSEHTFQIMEKLMLLDENESHQLFGKTGWAINGDDNIGWFVGYAVTKDNTYFMATNIKPAEGFDMSQFGRIRMEITLEALTGLMD